MREHSVAHHPASIREWFVKFHPKVDLTHLKVFFYKYAKAEVNFIPDFALVKKHIVNGKKAPKLTK